MPELVRPIVVTFQEEVANGVFQEGQLGRLEVFGASPGVVPKVCR